MTIDTRHVNYIDVLRMSDRTGAKGGEKLTMAFFAMKMLTGDW